MAPWPIQSPNVLTAHGVDLDHSIIRVAIPPGNRDKDTWSAQRTNLYPGEPLLSPAAVG
jgi:hypothetical protein